MPRSGSKAKDGERKKKKRDGKLVITMASYALQTPPRVAHAKPPNNFWYFSSDVRTVLFSAILVKDETELYGNNNGQLHIANATSGGERKATWANNNLQIRTI